MKRILYLAIAFVFGSLLGIMPAAASEPVLTYPTTFIVTIKVQPRNFSGLPELESWLSTYQYVAYISSGQNITQSFGSSGSNDCDDMALDMISKASKDGYILGYYMEKLTPTLSHLWTLAIIGNEFYFIDPITKKINFTDSQGDQWNVD